MARRSPGIPDALMATVMAGGLAVGEAQAAPQDFVEVAALTDSIDDGDRVPSLACDATSGTIMALVEGELMVGTADGGLSTITGTSALGSTEASGVKFMPDGTAVFKVGTELYSAPASSNWSAGVSSLTDLGLETDAGFSVDDSGVNMVTEYDGDNRDFGAYDASGSPVLDSSSANEDAGFTRADGTKCVRYFPDITNGYTADLYCETSPGNGSFADAGYSESVYGATNCEHLKGVLASVRDGSSYKFMIAYDHPLVDASGVSAGETSLVEVDGRMAEVTTSEDWQDSSLNVDSGLSVDIADEGEDLLSLSNLAGEWTLTGLEGEVEVNFDTDPRTGIIFGVAEGGMSAAMAPPPDAVTSWRETGLSWEVDASDSTTDETMDVKCLTEDVVTHTVLAGTTETVEYDEVCDIDIDGDGLTYSEEAAAGTDPESADTDGDGVDDGFDDCPTESGSSENNGCVEGSDTGNPDDTGDPDTGGEDSGDPDTGQDDSGNPDDTDTPDESNRNVPNNAPGDTGGCNSTGLNGLGGAALFVAGAGLLARRREDELSPTDPSEATSWQ